ncbi:hypothetical protein X971_0521 [Agrobacterium tumefaciens LBA4213 (Ach5)]|nr:hypothetical protein X971_0521 [Agrobacterium tumefaciens LBA4213 (Ach5)]
MNRLHRLLHLVWPEPTVLILRQTCGEARRCGSTGESDPEGDCENKNGAPLNAARHGIE